jgi:hypothetical protein
LQGRNRLDDADGGDGGLEGRMWIDRARAGRVTGLRGQRVEGAMMRTPDGHGRVELSRFEAPAIGSDHRAAPVNALGCLRAMFAVDDLDDTLARLTRIGAAGADRARSTGRGGGQGGRIRCAEPRLNRRRRRGAWSHRRM